MKKRMQKSWPWVLVALSCLLLTAPMPAQMLKATAHINGMI